MKKVYSKKVGGEVFALAPEQLEVFRNAGYQTPAPEEVIADAGAAMLTPPEDKRAYVVLNLKSGEFAVRVRSCIKDVLRMKFYERYMDDGLIISRSKEKLRECLEALRRLCAEHGIKLNEKKTQIIKLTRGFTFLKVRFR